MTRRQPSFGFPRRVLTVALAAVCVIALTGCGNGNGTGTGSEPAVPDAVIVDRVDCQAPNQFESWGLSPETPAPEQSQPEQAEPEQAEPEQAEPDQGEPSRPAPDRGRVPAGFEAVAATLCTLDFGTSLMHEAGTVSVTAIRFEGDLEPLVAALSEPSDSPGVNQLCTADMELVPELWLEDATGRAIRAAWPLTACNKTKPAAHEALDGLTQTSTQTFRYATAAVPVLPQLAPDASEIDWSEMGVTVNVDDVTPLPATPLPATPLP